MSDPSNDPHLDAVPSQRTGSKTLQGEEGIWILVLGEMIVFTLLFSVYLSYRADELLLFNRSQRLLNVPVGLASTLLLLTSSWFVFLGLEAMRERYARRAQLYLGAALLCGLAFGALKMVEYSNKLAAGISLVTNHFFMYYFMLTGIHMLHVSIGFVVLGYLYSKCATATSADIRTFENGATFWHMVDLLWIMLFSLLYLVR